MHPTPSARRAVVALGAIVMLALGACSDDSSTPTPTPTPTSVVSTTTVVVVSASTSTAPPTTFGATTTASVPPTTTAAPAVTTTLGPPPVAVTELRAGPGGGSGEISLTWRGVAGAVSYKVERAPAATGPFETGGFIGADGRGTRVDNVTNLFLSGDGTFTYVEVISTLSNGGVQRWYRVVALGAGGAAPPSLVVCGAPPGAPAC